jgi:hypothetical protein
MTLTGFDPLFYTVAFLVPGFILQWALSAFVPQKAVDSQFSFLRFLTLSCINYALWSWLIYLIYHVEFFTAAPGWTAVAWFVIVLVSPIGLAVLLTHLADRGTVRQVLQSIGLNPLHGIPTSWDYRFSTIDKAVWILVTLKDATSVAGLFGSQSFASSEREDRDLYVQEVWKIDDDGTWYRASPNAGILIRGDQIKHIEFWNDRRESDNVEQERTGLATEGLSTEASPSSQQYQ